MRLPSISFGHVQPLGERSTIIGQRGRLVKPFDVTLDHGYGYYLITHPEGLSDTAIALFRSWLIERFGTRVAAADQPVHLAVSNE